MEAWCNATKKSSCLLSNGLLIVDDQAEDKNENPVMHTNQGIPESA